MPQPRSSRSRPAQSATAAHRRLDRLLGVGGPVLDLVGRRVVPDVRAGDRVGPRTGQIRTRPFGVSTCTASTPGRAVRRDPVDLDVLERRLDGLPEPLADPARVTGDLQAGQGEPLVRARAGVQLVGDVPLDEERQLRVRDQAVDPDLLPRQVRAVGTVPVAGRRLAAEALLDLGDVVDRHDPPEPPAAQGRPGAHGLAERCLVGRGVVEHLDDLEVGVLRQRQDHVASTEPRMHAPVDEVCSEQLADALGGTGKTVGSGGVGEMVQAHDQILTPAPLPEDIGVGSLDVERLGDALVSGVSAGRRGAARGPSGTRGAPRSAPPARRTPPGP